MLLIASSTAGKLARSPETKARLGYLFVVVFVIVGLYRVLEFDNPFGPTVMATPAAFYDAATNNRVIVKSLIAGNQATCGFRA